MKQRCIAVVLALGLCSNVLALNYLGPPTTRMQAGQWAVGASYSHSNQDLDFGPFEWDDAEQDVILGRVGVGLVTNRLEISGLAGAANLEDDSFDTGYKFLLGGAFRVTMWKGKDLDWGIVGQGTYLNLEDTGIIQGTSTDFELRLGELQFGLGPCWRPGWGIIYGGAMFQWVLGTMDTTLLGDFDLREKTAIGIYGGGGIELARHLMLTGEVQATPDAFGWGTGLQLRF